MQPFKTPHRYIIGLTLGILTLVGALSLRIALNHSVSMQGTFLLLAIPAAVASWYGGIFPALVILTLTVLSVIFYFITPGHLDTVLSRPVVNDLSLFIIQTGWVALLIHLLDRFYTKSERERIRLSNEKYQSERQVKRLEASEGRFRRIVESDMIGIIFFNISGIITDSNSAFLEMTGHSEEELLSGRLRWTDATASQWHSIDTIAVEQLKERGVFASYEKEYKRKGRAPVQVLIGGALFEGSKTEGAAFILDISKRKAAEELVRYQAFHDALTSLPNRLLLQERLLQSCQYAKRDGCSCAVLLLDLDRFKIINDTLGHSAGDELLKEVAKRLKECVREDDTVARFGGDEFVVVANRIKNNQNVVDLITKIFESLEHLIMVGDQETFISTTIGVALYPQDGKDEQTLIKHADIALYHAKEKGRKTHSFYSQMEGDQDDSALTFEKELRKALQEDQFELYYQPIISLPDKEICSLEALIRWNHPTRGLLLPEAFISKAQETSQMDRVGEWVLGAACEQLAALPGGKLSISVNINGSHFYRQDFLDVVGRHLREHQIDPKRLTLELTEDVLMRHLETAVAKVMALRELGVQISIDNFGIGHTSLHNLKNLPFDRLKIDKSFTQAALTSKPDTDIIRAVTSLTHNLGRRVVAEGVETQAQLEHLQAIQACDEVQGYLISQPLAVTALGIFLTKSERPTPLVKKHQLKNRKIHPHQR